MENVREKQQLEIRIERLEKQNRRFKMGALTLLAALVSVSLLGQTKQTRKPAPKAAAAPAAPGTPDQIEAHSFVLKDSTGKVRAELSMTGTGPGLKLRDEAGTALVTLSLNDSAPQGPILLMSDPQHKAGVSVSVLSGNGSQLSLVGERPDIQARMAVAPAGTSFEMSDAEGFTTSIGNGLQTAKSNKQPKQTTAASITLYGKDRKLLWSTP
ncbi:MAG TPA: hypothetical protein VFE02_12460 [Candidatus Acidoferrales bacterium]|jgi:hypothetical protein|nr:hypothetical protein [Candidatus Acidoferrales bacterium]